MIKLEHINKYYFKGESREIHVINDISLTLPKTGFVTILGASGSGKTTLLNIIGGLDKFDSGTISYKDKFFDKYKMDEVDALRNDMMGYIFQNYLLVENLSVYENLKVALDAIDLVDKIEQNKRIEHALKAVGLFKFRKKLVKNLSGGQMQRVSIARCIVKDSEVIIADEPTGNIDSENTIQIMNILKKLSETKLVILVTHETNIARYYSDRIILLKDGKVIHDGIVTNNGSLTTQTDRKIYLGDLINEKIKINKLDVNSYSDNKSSNLDLTVVVRNDTIYVKSSKKIINLDESSIELINEAYDTPKNLAENFEFDTSWYKEPDKVLKKKIFWTNFFNGFKEFKNQSKSKIFILIINIILGLLIGACFINLAKFTYVDLETVCKEDVGQVVTDLNTEYELLAPSLDRDTYRDMYDAGIIDEVTPFKYESNYLSLKENYIFHEEIEISYWLLPYPYDKNITLIEGVKPYNNYVVIGKELADNLNNFYGNDKGDYKKLLNTTFNNYKICGVSSNDTMTVYVNPVILYTDKISNRNNNGYVIGNINNYNNTFELISGYLPNNEKEVLLDYKVANELNLNVGDSIKLQDEYYNITGLYKDKNIVLLPSVLTLKNSICGYVINPNDFNLSKAKYSYSLHYLPKYEYEIILGRDILDSSECIVHAESNLSIGQSIFGYKIVGIYNKNYNQGSSGNNFMYNNIVIYCGDKIQDNQYAFEFNSNAKEYFKENRFKVYELNDYQLMAARKNHNYDNIALLIISMVLLGVVIMLTYLTNRSRIVNEIKTIGVYRSIGKSRNCLIYQKLGYNILTTSISTVIGYTLAWVINSFTSEVTQIYSEKVPVNTFIIILGVVVLYFIGIVIGLIPTKSLIRKTPSEINSKYDI